MKKVTKYFRNAILASTQRSIDYKKNKFVTISWSEIQSGKIDLKKFDKRCICSAEKEEEKDNYSKNLIIALKTVATEYSETGYVEENIDEMTSILFMPVKVFKDGMLFYQDDKYPWIPREYLSPMVEPQIAIGKSEEYDNFLEESTDKRNQIDSWDKYLNYAIEMFEYVTKSIFFEDLLTEQQIKTDGKFYIFEDEDVNASFHLVQLYNHLLNDDETKLYTKITSGIMEPTSIIRDKLSYEKMIYHSGQMGAEYPLSPSQREAISCFEEIGEGEVLAVNGPPGTGKTTLLQSIVANMYVRAAIGKEKPPVIIATSTNNQAVTNIIDSFGKINPVGIKNLERRWITGVHSFSVYFPSKGKYAEAQKKNYQYTNVNGDVFVEEVESEENRVQAKKLFKEEFCKYFGEQIDSFEAATHYLSMELLKIEEKRKKCLECVEIVKVHTGNQTIGAYITWLKNKISDINIQIQLLREKEKLYQDYGKRFINRSREWRILYDGLPWYVRWLKFIPYFKKKIISWSYQNMNYDELDFLERGMEIDEIENRYYTKIIENDEKIRSLKNKIIQIEKEEEKYNEEEKEIYNLIDIAINSFKEFKSYNISVDEQIFWEDINIRKLNDILDKVRYVEFWVAVHYYEALWLKEECTITDKQKGKNFESVLREMYGRLAMVTPCMVMTCYMLPKQFLAYDSNEKKRYYLYNFADLLIVDEAGQISPEIGVPAFAFAKKAVVVGDEQQISPVWGTSRALDIAMAISNGVIKNEKEYTDIEKNGLNCSQSSIMKIASNSCKFEKFGKGLFLCEHRRCYNEIIQYCNELVYEGNLEPLRGNAATDEKNVLKNYLPPMGRKQIDSTYSQRVGTSRKNVKEAEEIVAWVSVNYSSLCEKYKDYEKEGQFDEKNILGIITPFKGQSIVIKRMIKSQLPDIKNNIEVGTVHTFQGAERKVIIFSSVYGSEEGCYFINQNKSLMNVAVSRAKDSFLVFGDSRCLVGNSKSVGQMLRQATTGVIE